MEGVSGLTRSTIDELDSWHIEGGQMEGERMVLLEVSLKNFIVRISSVIKWKVKVVLLEVSLMNFVFGIPNDIKWKVKVVILEVPLINFILGISKEVKW